MIDNVRGAESDRLQSWRFLAVALAVILGVSPAARSAQLEKTAGLSDADRAAGWKMLFDGKSTDAWRGYRKDEFPSKGWEIEDQCLKVEAKGKGGDIITREQYGDFELVLEWRVSAKANSGIMYRVIEKHSTSWQTGPEYQILDDAGYGDSLKPGQMSGALYDLYEPSSAKAMKPTGEFNRTRIRLKDNLLQHWLNGVKVVECRTDGDEWSKRIAASKFGKYKGFGLQPRGHIALQEHGHDVWFRNIRIRDLSAPLPNEVRLFNGKDLVGWNSISTREGTTIDDVWSVKDGILICKGRPIGYIRTTADYTNYVLKLDWRFNPVTKKAGNGGILLRMIGEDTVWPRSVEAQLQNRNAGDFWNIGRFPMKVVIERTNGRNTKKTHMAERPLGEWNEYEIIVNRGDVILKVNGETLNHAWDVEELPGKICRQSEGAEIHFRNIRLSPIE
ncbi:MAG: DUF1080 domain-containing protein [Planctomycetes bacterium]|nr:DUF1080 domain-containing protein [Planctomycetota bacterium]